MLDDSALISISFVIVITAITSYYYSDVYSDLPPRFTINRLYEIMDNVLIGALASIATIIIFQYLLGTEKLNRWINGQPHN